MSSMPKPHPAPQSNDLLKMIGTISEIAYRMEELLSQATSPQWAEYAEEQATAPAFEFALGQQVRIEVSREIGCVISRAQRLACENQYLLRYQDASGKAVETWWGVDALTKHE